MELFACGGRICYNFCGYRIILCYRLFRALYSCIVVCIRNKVRGMTRMRKKLPTFIFDLGGVYFTDGTAIAISVIKKNFSIDEMRIKCVFYGELGIAYRENKITHEMFWESAVKKWRLGNVDISELSKIWLDGYTPIDEVVDIVLHLKSAGCEILYLSGSTKERILHLEKRYNFLQNFDDGIFSFDLGLRKAEPEMYVAAIKKASNESDNCVFIDNCEKNLLLAKNVGMHTILYETPNKLITDINSKFSFTLSI